MKLRLVLLSLAVGLTLCAAGAQADSTWAIQQKCLEAMSSRFALSHHLMASCRTIRNDFALDCVFHLNTDTYDIEAISKLRACGRIVNFQGADCVRQSPMPALRSIKECARRFAPPALSSDDSSGATQDTPVTLDYAQECIDRIANPNTEQKSACRSIDNRYAMGCVYRVASPSTADIYACANVSTPAGLGCVESTASPSPSDIRACARK